MMQPLRGRQVAIVVWATLLMSSPAVAVRADSLNIVASDEGTTRPVQADCNSLDNTGFTGPHVILPADSIPPNPGPATCFQRRFPWRGNRLTF